MTTHESFKKRIRARMERTGERYASARRSLIEQAAVAGDRVWIAEPELSDDAVRAKTARGWNDWCDLIDAWPGHRKGHAAIAAHLVEVHAVDAWWAQTITVGYERITGRRLPYQRPDGTFTASKSMTIAIDSQRLRSLLLDDVDRADLVPGFDTHLRSRPTSKVVRLAMGPGVASFTLEAKDGDRTKVTVAHEALPSLDEVAQWKYHWTDWLEAIGQA